MRVGFLWRRSALVAFPVGVVAATCLAAAPVAFAADPAGNNGTVKIDGEVFDTHPANEPHVGCIFEVDFYGFDKGDLLDATVTFTVHPPSGGPGTVLDVEPKTVFIGGDEAGGGTDLDAEQQYDLSAALAAVGAVEHPQQGFHVELTVNAEGSIGADVKHKVFWVQACPFLP